MEEGRQAGEGIKQQQGESMLDTAKGFASSVVGKVRACLLCTGAWAEQAAHRQVVLSQSKASASAIWGRASKCACSAFLIVYNDIFNIVDEEGII